MSLLCRKLVRKVAENDITCYKVLEAKAVPIGPASRPFAFETVYRSLFIEYKFGKEITRGMVLRPDPADREQARRADDGLDGHLIEAGFIHSYQDAADAMRLAANPFVSHTAEVYECVIPKGVEYYDGENHTRGVGGDGVPCFAAKELRVVRKMD